MRWYGTNATGGTPSTLASQPATTEAGTFKYYVAQLSNTNNCESERTEVAVEVRPASAPPGVAAVNYCQGAPANPVSAVAASGGVLQWYTAATGGNAIAAPTPATNNPGTQTYFVAQAVNGACESQRTPLTVTVTATPGAPALNVPAAYCQNVPGEALTGAGQNLRWYETLSGGEGTASLRPGTSEAGTRTYYATQTVSGCESARSSVNVVVKPQPAAPTASGPTTLCQFSPATEMSANGQNLEWYTADDRPLGRQAPPINTETGRVFTHRATQTVEGCVSPKGVVSVTILTTPTPTASRTSVELCQGAAAQPLSATGTNLRWTDPAGTTSTVAPTPSTIKTSSNEGDLYFVTQTGTNGCESPRLPIRVFVQTVPVLSLTGSSTVNLGLEVPIKLSFTGVGPYSYTLTNGLTGTATKDTTVLLLPDKTTLYQATQVTNRCGAGTAGSGATATVLIPQIQTMPLTATTLCVGQLLTTAFTTAGTFNPGSLFKLQIARLLTDTTALQYADVPNQGSTQTQASGVLSTSLAEGAYWVRVIATNPKIPVVGSRSPTALFVRPLPTATLNGPARINETYPANLTITFSGDAPWAVSLLDSNHATKAVALKSIETAANPYVLEVKPTKTSSYQITSVQNNCGVGPKPTASLLLTVDALLATRDGFSVNAYPIPATQSVQVVVKGVSTNQTAIIELINLAGHVIHQQESTQETTTLPLDQQAGGIYILRVSVDGQTVSRRITKL